MVNQNCFSVNQLSKMVGISARTLHYYDQIGLLSPKRDKHNNYRYYDQNSILRLQQILFYKELDLPLEQISLILSDPRFDLLEALESHKKALIQKSQRMEVLLNTIETTIKSLKGNVQMSNSELFKGFSDEQQAEYEKQAAELWDPEIVKQSNQNWRNMTKTEQDAIMAEGETITLALHKAMPLGAESPEIQELVGKWHTYINHFYHCDLEILRGLGQMYAEHPEFRAFYTKIDKDLPDFFNQAIQIYCDLQEK